MKSKFVTKLEKERDLMATVIYIYTEIFDNPSYWGNVDNAMDLAKAFIKKYPTGTDWGRATYAWEERIYEFVKKHHKQTKKPSKRIITVCVEDGSAIGVEGVGSDIEVWIHDYDMTDDVDEDGEQFFRNESGKMYHRIIL